MANENPRLWFEKRKGYLYATIECGALTPHASYAALGDILIEASRVRCKRIMVKCNVASIETDDMLLESMLALASMRSASRIAFVECRTPSQKHPAIGADFKLFDDAKSAEKWLMAAEPSGQFTPAVS